MWGDQPRLHESGDEGAGAGERVENVDIVVGETLAEMLTGDGVGGVEDPVNNLDGGVDDAECIGLFLEPDLEEPLV